MKDAIRNLLECSNEIPHFPSVFLQYLFLTQKLLLHQVAGRDHQHSANLWVSSADVHRAEGRENGLSSATENCLLMQRT